MGIKPHMLGQKTINLATYKGTAELSDASGTWGVGEVFGSEAFLTIGKSTGQAATSVHCSLRQYSSA